MGLRCRRGVGDLIPQETSSSVARHARLEFAVGAISSGVLRAGGLVNDLGPTGAED